MGLGEFESGWVGLAGFGWVWVGLAGFGSFGSFLILLCTLSGISISLTFMTV